MEGVLGIKSGARSDAHGLNAHSSLNPGEGEELDSHKMTRKSRDDTKAEKCLIEWYFSLSLMATA